MPGKAIRATSTNRKWRGGKYLRVSAHHKGIELVALGIPEIGGVKFLIALAGRAFAGAAERQGKLVDAIYMGLVLGPERRHHPVAHRHRFAVKGKSHAK